MSIDYKAAAIHLWYQDGNRSRYDDAIEASKAHYLDRAHQIVDAALGDTVLYRKETYEEAKAARYQGDPYIQVYPKGDSE